MKHFYSPFSLVISMAMWSLASNAHDIEVPNADGVMIYYNISKDDTQLQVTYSNNSDEKYKGEVVIPDEVEYSEKTYKVTSLDSFAFMYCSELTAVTIPEGLNSLGAKIFTGCSSLVTVNIKSKKFIETNFGFGGGCASLFGNQIKNCTLKDDVTTIGNYFFAQCSNLTTLEIPGCVTKIGNSTFESCSSLSSLTVPSSVESMGSYVFSNCESLTSVTFLGDIPTFGDYAFWQAKNIKTIYSYTDMPSAYSDDRFAGIYNKVTLYVPYGCKEIYQNTNGWKKFANIVEMEPSGIHGVSTSTVGASVMGYYSLEGKFALQAQKGINIVKNSNGTTTTVIVK